MVESAGLKNLEISIICSLASFAFVLIVFILVMFLMKKRKRSRENDLQRKNTLNKSEHRLYEEERRSLLATKKKDSSKLKYVCMFNKENEVLELRVNEIEIGKRAPCTKPHISELENLFFRVQMNNIASNSIVISDIYRFSFHLTLEEIYMFAIKDNQLSSTSIVIEVFVTLMNKNFDLLLGWLEIKLPSDPQHYPIFDKPTLKEFDRSIDLYMNPVGYACLTLVSLDDAVKVVLLASTCPYEHWRKEDNKDATLFFNIKLKDSDYPLFNHTCKTGMKTPGSTILWNEVFFFDIPDESKSNCVLRIELLKASLTPNIIEVVGYLELGLLDRLPVKSRMHWEDILHEENKEICRWHPILSTQ